jgi:hypothetical protein
MWRPEEGAMKEADETDDQEGRGTYELGGRPEDDLALPSEQTDEPAPGFPLGLLLAGLAVVAVVVAVILIFLLGRPAAERPGQTVAARPEAPGAGPTASPTPEPGLEPLVLPPLDQSDALLRELVSRLSSHPDLAAWLVNEDLARRFVAAVDNIAAGETPVRHLRFLAPTGRFQAAAGAHSYVIDARSYERYDHVAAVVESIDDDGAARLFLQLEPLLVVAYRELGYPDGRFRQAFERAAARLLSVPVLEGEVPLLPAVLSYRFADPRLEALAPAEKQLLRMGPRNVRRLQAKLRGILAALESVSSKAAGPEPAPRANTEASPVAPAPGRP